MKVQSNIVMKLFPDGTPHIYIEKEYIPDQQMALCEKENEIVIKDDRIVFKNPSESDYENIKKNIKKGIERYKTFWENSIKNNEALNEYDIHIIMNNMENFKKIDEIIPVASKQKQQEPYSNMIM